MRRYLGSPEITLGWLLSNIPLRFWLWLMGSWITVFLAGVGVGQTPLVNALMGRPAESTARSPLAERAVISLLPGDFILDLSNVYERSNVITVKVKVVAKSGVAELTRRAELISMDYDSSLFTRAVSDVKLISVQPSIPIVRALGSEGEIALDFDTQGLIPLATTDLRAGDRLLFGHASVVIHFAANAKELADTLEIPLFLEKTH